MRFDLEIPSDLDPQLGILFGTLEDGTREWFEEMVDPSPESMVWQPYEYGYSAGGQLMHIAEVEVFWIQRIICERDVQLPEADLMEEIDQDEHHWPRPPAEPLDWYMNVIRRVRQETLECLKGQDPSREIQRSNGRILTVRWIMAHVVEHDSYHGGQAVALNMMFKKMRT